MQNCSGGACYERLSVGRPPLGASLPGSARAASTIETVVPKLNGSFVLACSNAIVAFSSRLHVFTTALPDVSPIHLLASVLLELASRAPPSFRGGRLQKRDRWYGLESKDDFDEFRRWWHRKGKTTYGEGKDLPGREAAEDMYEQWVLLGRPKVWS